MSDPESIPCESCGSPNPSAALTCAACGRFTRSRQLLYLAQSAAQLERSEPRRAAELWQHSTLLLPSDSDARQFALARAQALMRGDRLPSLIPKAITAKGVAITIVSMLISIGVYTTMMQSWRIAAGFVLLILVHEMGHVIANMRYGISASLPIFIPFVGAIITLRQQPPNAKVEAIIGIAGPVAGTVGALICFAWYLKTGSPLALLLAWFGFTINLFNMLPVPPLDGGRVAAAISPWIWLVGLIGLGALVAEDYRHGRNVGILFVLLIIALPRVIRTLKGDERKGAYYNIGRRNSLMIGAGYLSLLALLAVGRWYAQSHLQLGQYL